MKNNKAQNIFEYICIFLLLFLSSGFQLSVYSGVTRMIMYLIVVLIMIMSRLEIFKFYKFNKISFVAIFLLFFNVFVTFLVRDEGLEQIVITSALYLVALMYVIYFDEDIFIKKFIQVMYFLCIMSLFLYFLMLLFPQITRHLPVVYNSKGVSAYSIFFSTISANNYLIRNQGIFWEPGAFQTYIDIAMIFNLFLFKKHRIRNLLVFSLTLFTTYSTAGYIVGSIIIMIFLLNLLKERGQKRSFVIALFFVMIIAILGIVTYSNLPKSARHQVFGKLESYQKGGERSSTSVRFSSIMIPFKSFLDKPFFGNGVLGMERIANSEGYNMNTATVINWFSTFGIITGMVIIVGLYRLCGTLKCSRFFRILLFGVFLLSLMSENYIRNPSILIFVFLGYKDLKNKVLQII